MGTPSQHEQRDGAFTLGRGTSSDVVIPDYSMSRQHARIELDDDAWVLEDLGARNGTFVNGHRITKTQLLPNDQIRAGETQFLFTTEAQPEAMPTLRDVHKPKVLK